MAVEYNRSKIGKGIYLTEIYDKKFKTNCVKFTFLAPLHKETVCVNALLQYLLVSSNSQIKSRTEISKKMAGLYGSALSANYGSVGNYQSMGLGTIFIGDKYTIGGEKISTEAVKQLMLCLFSPDLPNGKFNEQYFKLRKQELIDSIKATVNDKRTYAQMQATKLIYKDEPSSIMSNVTPDAAEKVTQEDLIKQYEVLKKHAAIEITVCGGGSSDEVIEMIKEEVSKLERADVYQIDFRSNSPLKQQICEKEDTMNISQSKMVMAYKSDYDNIYVAKLFSALLGATPFSKLFSNVREKLSLCYYCASNYSDRKGTMIIDSGVETQNIEKAKQAIGEQVEAVANGEFTDDELYNTKIYLANAYKLNCDGVFDLAAWYEAQNSRGTSLTPQQVGELIFNITREQIIECAKSFHLDTIYVMKAEQEVADDE